MRPSLSADGQSKGATPRGNARAVHRPETSPVVTRSAGGSIVLSISDGAAGELTVVLLPRYPHHPLFYEDFLEALSRVRAGARAALVPVRPVSHPAGGITGVGSAQPAGRLSRR